APGGRAGQRLTGPADESSAESILISSTYARPRRERPPERSLRKAWCGGPVSSDGRIPTAMAQNPEYKRPEVRVPRVGVAEGSNARRARLLLGAFGDPGHSFPRIAPGRALAARGHAVVLHDWSGWVAHVP